MHVLDGGHFAIFDHAAKVHAGIAEELRDLTTVETRQ
jgi:surfactin synthase thioesterase subunit